DREGAGLSPCCPDQLLPGTESIDTERSRIGIYFRPPEAFLCDPGHIGLGVRGRLPVPLRCGLGFSERFSMIEKDLVPLRVPDRSGSWIDEVAGQHAVTGAARGAGVIALGRLRGYGATSARRRRRVSGSMTRARVMVACSPTSSAAAEAVPSPALKAPTW